MHSDAALNGPSGTARQHQFRALPRDQQPHAIRRLSIIGHADEAIPPRRDCRFSKFEKFSERRKGQ